MDTLREFLRSLPARIADLRERMTVERAFVIGGVVVVLLFGVLWARAGFTLSISRFFAATNQAPIGGGGGGGVSPTPTSTPGAPGTTPATATANPAYPTSWPACLVYNLDGNYDGYNWASQNANGNPNKIVTDMYPDQTVLRLAGQVVYNNCPFTVHLQLFTVGSVKAGGDTTGSDLVQDTNAAFDRLLPGGNQDFPSCWAGQTAGSGDAAGCKGPFEIDYDTTFYTCGRVFAAATWHQAGDSGNPGGGAASVFNYGLDCTGAPGEKAPGGASGGGGTGNACFDNCYTNIAPGNGSYCTQYCASGGGGGGSGSGSCTQTPVQLSVQCSVVQNGQTGNYLTWTQGAPCVVFNQLSKSTACTNINNCSRIGSPLINENNTSAFNVHTFSYFDTSSPINTISYFHKAGPPNSTASNIVSCPGGPFGPNPGGGTPTPTPGTITPTPSGATPTPGVITPTPTPYPTNTSSATQYPTPTPTLYPTTVPTVTYTPTTVPSIGPGGSPTTSPTVVPTITYIPTTAPTSGPTVVPTITYIPTVVPSTDPNGAPTTSPTLIPTVTYIPTIGPTSLTTGGGFPDADHDGIPDSVECPGVSNPQPSLCPDTDHDGIPDYLDIDSDNDGIPDNQDPNRLVPGTNPITSTDSDGDGIPNSVECPGIATPSQGSCPDTDHDGTPDYLDTDSDNDGIPDSVECGAVGGTCVDTDHDGIPDYLDTDSDGDGIPDALECANFAQTGVCSDTDADGIPNYRDTDSDGDGIPDAQDPTVLIPGTVPLSSTDADGDGIPDTTECPGVVNPQLNPGLCPDTDHDGVPDYLDPDSDNDGIPDSVECGAVGGVCVDTDHDGIPNYRDTDSDNDGIPDGLDTNRLVVNTISNVSSVQTGPGEVTLLAFLVASIVSLAYVSYVHSPAGRRRDARKVADDQGPMDFRT